MFVGHDLEQRGKGKQRRSHLQEENREGRGGIVKEREVQGGFLHCHTLIGIVFYGPNRLKL
jgi:hypothetical protein